MTGADVTRRGLLRGAAGLGVAAGAGPALAQSSGIDYGGWFDNVGNYEGETVDKTGQDEVTITVGAAGNGGAFAFEAPAVAVSTGTTVVWEWTGNGGSHNVVAEDSTFESELVGDSGHTFEYTFEASGVYRYACTPHESMGMKGAVAVGQTGVASSGSNSETAESGDTGGSTPDFGDWFGNVGNYEDEVLDETTSDEVTITVGAAGNGGAFAFDPPAVEVSPGTTVVWEWTGNGGSHNVVAEDGTFESELVGNSGHTFEYTFEASGVYRYACTPHKSMGMKGAVVVSEAGSASGDSGSAGGSSGGGELSPGASALGVSLLLAFLSPLGLAAFLHRRSGEETASARGPRTGN